VSIRPANAQTATHNFLWSDCLKDMLPMIPGELNSDYRARLAHEQVLAEDRRRAELSELRATANAPEARIRAWERTHGLSLPRGAEHPVLVSVAAATSLTLEQVHAEQRRRLQPATPAA
jgi:hypothetical protein